MRVAILASLQKEGPGTRGEIAKRLDAVEVTVQMHLRALERLGLVTSDPPPETRKSGQRVRYSANAADIAKSLDALARAAQGQTD